jgi:hypothetical protein
MDGPTGPDSRAAAAPRRATAVLQPSGDRRTHRGGRDLAGRRARIVLAGFAVVLAWCVYVAASSPSQAPPRSAVATSVSDPETYAIMVGRLRTGEGYYATIGDVLRQRGYATREIFNWRTPLLMTVLARFSDRAGAMILVSAAWTGLALALVVVAWRRETMVFAVLAAAGSGAALMLSAPQIYLMSESWIGVLLALSATAYLAGWRRGAILCGLSALFVRELAAVYCGVAAVHAVATRRWNEVRLWACGFALYAGYYAWHVTHVLASRRPDDLAHAASWLEMRGTRFVLDTMVWNLWMAAGPAWLVGVFAAGVLAVAGARRVPREVRDGALAYVITFALVGKHFDTYWGLAAGPLWAVACAFGVNAVIESAGAEWRSLGGRAHPRPDGPAVELRETR